jgi:predicted fused transcriptional regulator/phosphomethylpyrimidine kinase
MSEPNKDGTDIMMALLMGLSGPRSSKAWNESQQIKAESFLTMAEHWINQTAAENARLKAEVERLTKAIDLTIIDLDERHERQDLRAWEFAELLRKAKGVQS